MTASPRVRRTGLRTLAAGAVAAFLATAAPVTATAASSHTAAGAATRAGEVIRCGEVAADLPDVFGRNCDSDRWGPISGFTIADHNSGQSYRCRTGWVEGSLWVLGQDCQPDGNGEG
jgi:hypothetical protein